MKTAQLDAAVSMAARPQAYRTIWGGDELVREYGKHGYPHVKLGESWECWETDAVTNGALKGCALATLRGTRR